MIAQIRWLLAICIFTVAKYCCPRLAPQSLILASTINLVFMQLLHRGFLGDHGNDVGVSENTQYVLNLFTFMVANYNTFLTTLCSIPLITITNAVISVRMQMQETKKYNELTGEELTLTEREE